MPPKRRLADIVSTTPDKRPRLDDSSDWIQEAVLVEYSSDASMLLQDVGETTQATEVVTEDVKIVLLPEGQHFSSVIQDRITKSVSLTWPDIHTYSINQLPLFATWGTHMPSIRKDLSSYLCADFTNDTLIFWIIGTISRIWFFNREGPAPHVSISIVPCVADASKMAKDQLRVLSRPKNLFIDNVPGELQASRSSPNEYTGFDRDHWFEAVYDARTAFTKKGAMEPYSPKKLDIGDLVLTEVKVKRFKPRPTDGSLVIQLGWEWWRAYFELQSVSIIANLRLETIEETDGPSFMETI
ncbi:hypothetical protein JAAARDRAFT_198654 [Jaapia argillacea MUCL 33604]|uniref:Uncharacterized protein n=1 Tax=Jaapia argillacea MUCL 33604 TaxID=933084 RepID=A0A067PLW7_9AGAM|nr:hypothetical protein JAAARDRAFT_198654 [Jaapia argillacea MUCL 33604]